MAGIELAASKVAIQGLEYDRRWMIVDENNRFVSQREYPVLALLGVFIEPPYLILYDRYFAGDRVSVDLDIDQSPYDLEEVTVWDDRVAAVPISPDADEWLSEKLQANLRLFGLPSTAWRAADPKFAPEGQAVSFADGFPYLVVGQASLDDLNTRLEIPLPMNRFRPNFVFSGGQPYEEDNYTDFSIGNQLFKGVKPCARCIMTTIHQDTTRLAAEPLKTLATYRKKGNKILFGQNVVWTGTDPGEVRVGDEIKLR